MGREFTARWPFTCACCGVEQPEGTMAKYDDHGHLRSNEPDHMDIEPLDPQIETRDRNLRVEVMPRGKTKADRCDECFMIHATSQTECY